MKEICECCSGLGVEEEIDGNMSSCINCNGNGYHEYSDLDELKELCSKLLKGADKCNKEPYYIIQHFLNIIKEHKEIINKYKLL